MLVGGSYESILQNMVASNWCFVDCDCVALYCETPTCGRRSSLQIPRRHNYYSCDTDRVGQTCRRGVGTCRAVVFRTATWRHIHFSEVLKINRSANHPVLPAD